MQQAVGCSTPAKAERGPKTVPLWAQRQPAEGRGGSSSCCLFSSTLPVLLLKPRFLKEWRMGMRQGEQLQGKERPSTRGEEVLCHSGKWDFWKSVKAWRCIHCLKIQFVLCSNVKSSTLKNIVHLQYVKPNNHPHRFFFIHKKISICVSKEISICFSK